MIPFFDGAAVRAAVSPGRALDAVKDALSAYDVYVSTDLGNTLQETTDP